MRNGDPTSIKLTKAQFFGVGLFCVCGLAKIKYTTDSSNDHYFWYEYDTLGRLRYIYSDTDSNPAGRIKEAKYSAYAADGQPMQVTLGGSTIQTVDYSYYSQGWVNKLNNNSVYGGGNTDKFAMNLDYTHNGTISVQQWAQAEESVLYDVEYAYTYDAANRLTAADYSNSDPGSSEVNGNLEWVADADKFGQYIIGKHKSTTDTVINMKSLIFE